MITHFGQAQRILLLKVQIGGCTRNKSRLKKNQPNEPPHRRSIAHLLKPEGARRENQVGTAASAVPFGASPSEFFASGLQSPTKTRRIFVESALRSHSAPQEHRLPSHAPAAYSRGQQLTS